MNLALAVMQDDKELMLSLRARAAVRRQDTCRGPDDRLANQLDAAANAIERLASVNDRYEEIIYQVAKKFPHESRHDTAVRYIREREQQPGGVAAMARPHRVELMTDEKGDELTPDNPILGLEKGE